ncbi:hypothetical protein P7K49_038265, partial [Saguinus oedipus]
PVPKQIERYSRFSPSPLSIKQFLDFGEYGPRVPMGSGLPPFGLPPWVSAALGQG